jgi:peptide/nickel transport system permease protein
MLNYIIRRFFQIFIVFFIVTIMIFTITRILPGDIATTIVGQDVTEEQRAIIEEEYGLNKPMIVQYYDWISGVFKGDFGRSFRTKEPVINMIKQRFPATMELTIFAMLLAITIGLLAGSIAATRRNSISDISVTIFSMFGMAIPAFWLGILLILLFALKLRILPPSGYVPLFRDPVQNLKLMILPAITLGLTMSAGLMRQIRGSMLNVLSQPYIDTARAKGLKERSVIIKHVLRNSLIPILTVIGMQIGVLLGGSVVVETIFSIPGMGNMIVLGIFARDYPVVQGGIFLFIAFVLIINFLTDISYAFVDPRIKYK